MRYSLLAVGVAAALSLTACNKAEEAATDAGAAVDHAAQEAGQAVDHAAQEAGQAGEAAVAAVTGDVAKYKDVAGVSMNISGAGASFPAPIYAKWSSDFKAGTDGQVNYQSIGSSGGIKQIIAKTVDFGASDAPMTPEELAENDLIQFPTVIGGVVPVVNVEGVGAGELVLDGDTLAKIYMGQIKKWNDPAIAALNSGVTLPDSDITTVHRSDGSGTTFNFTDYLAKVSSDWESNVGVSKSITWPTDTMGTGVGGKGNEGVASMVKQVPNSIGYVEYAYAKQNNMSHAAMVNAAGNTVQPSAETFAAAGDIDWSQQEGFYKVITNSDTAEAWPISAATFILVHKNPENPEQVAGVLNFFDWAYSMGDQAALDLDYVPFSDKAVALFKEKWSEVKGADGQPVYTPQS